MIKLFRWKTSPLNPSEEEKLKHGAIESVKKSRAEVAISCGNTGSLMAISTLILRRLPNVKRPAIAIFWPSTSEKGFNVVLDAGADIKAQSSDLLAYAKFGSNIFSKVFNSQR